MGLCKVLVLLSKLESFLYSELKNWGRKWGWLEVHTSFFKDNSNSESLKSFGKWIGWPTGPFCMGLRVSQGFRIFSIKLGQSHANWDSQSSRFASHTHTHAHTPNVIFPQIMQQFFYNHPNRIWNCRSKRFRNFHKFTQTGDEGPLM